MKISVIIPAYNAEKTLEAAVQSVMGQDYPKLEIILVDDGGTDTTGTICDCLTETDNRIRVIHQENKGVSAARNRGIQEAQGDAILFLDVDDFLMPDALKILAASLTDITDACCGKILRGTEKGIPGNEESSQVLQGDELINEALAHATDLLTIHGWLFRKKVFKDNGILFNAELKMGEDSELVLRYLNACRGAALIPQSVYRYSIAPDSAVHGWKPGQAEQYLKTLEVIQKTESSKQQNWPIFVLTKLLLILTHDTFHPANPAGLKEQFTETKRLRELPVIAEAFEKADLSQIKDQRRIVLQWLKAGQILPAWIAVKIRQRQNRKKA